MGTQRGSILVVEDDSDIRNSLEEVLALEGFSVHTAKDGREALQALDKIERPSLILLDLAMPVMDGAQFLDVRKGNAILREIPVVLLTAAGTSKSNHIVATEVVKKPVDIDSLISVVRRYVA